jgi:hypothetical protein
LRRRQDRAFGAGQALVHGLPLPNAFCAREFLELPIELASPLEVVDEAGMEVEQVGSLSVLKAQRQSLRVALAEDVLGDGVLQCGQELVALRGRHLAVGHRRIQQDL